MKFKNTIVRLATLLKFDRGFMKNIGSSRLLELDALRGFAVTSVVLFHITMRSEVTRYGLKFGVTGVDLFFIISGFVILLTLEKNNHWKDFVVSRFSRLYPTYWICVTITAVLSIVVNILQNKSSQGLGLQYLVNMTMFQSYFRVPDLDGSYWTMAEEMSFYLFMLLVSLTKQLKKIEIIGCIALTLTVFYHLLLNTKYHFLHEVISTYIPIVNHYPLFLSGIIFYNIKFGKPKFYRYLGVALCFGIQYNLFFDGGHSKFFISQREYGFMLMLYFAIFLLYVNNHLYFIVNKISLFLGKISYSLYLIHYLLGVSIVTVLTKYCHLNIWISSLLITLPIILVVATLINKYIENPSMHYIRSKYKQQL